MGPARQGQVQEGLTSVAAGVAVAAVLVVVLPALFLLTGALVCAVLGESLSGD